MGAHQTEDIGEIRFMTPEILRRRLSNSGYAKRREESGQVAEEMRATGRQMAQQLFRGPALTCN